MVCLAYGWVLSIRFVGLHPTFSRHGIAQILSALGELIWLDEKVGVHPTFSHHGIAQILSALGELIWLNEKVVFPTFPHFSTSPLLFYIFFFFLEKMIVLTRREYL